MSSAQVINRLQMSGGRTVANGSKSISQLVIDEAAGGDPAAARVRLDALNEFPLLDITEEVQELAAGLLRSLALPSKATTDAAHIAVAAVHQMQFLLTWNCTHIANAIVREKIETVCRKAGFRPPVICTPLELSEEEP